MVDPTLGSGTDFADVISFLVNFLQPAYYFANGAFGAVGTYQAGAHSPEQAATLVVSQVGGVPEPATWALISGGFGFVGAAARRRRQIAEPA